MLKICPTDGGKLLLPFVGGCGIPKRAKAVASGVEMTIEAVTDLPDFAERVAQGRPEDVLPALMSVLSSSGDYRVVSREENSVVAEIHRIQGLGIDIPKLANEAYYLRADLQAVGSATKVGLKFFKAARGNFKKLVKPDSVVSKGASQLLGVIFASLLKAGVMFL